MGTLWRRVLVEMQNFAWEVMVGAARLWSESKVADVIGRTTGETEGFAGLRRKRWRLGMLR